MTIWKATTAATAALMLALPAQAADLGGNCCADLEERVAELESTVARKGNRKVSLTVYGHVNEAVLFWSADDVPGDITKSRVIPATQSQSRFGFKGEVKINNDWAAGYLIEIGVGGFDAATEDGPGGKVNRDLSVRHSAVYIQSKAIGTFWLGQTSMATDGAAEIDLSKTSVAALPLTLLPVDNAILGLSVSQFDGPRKNVVRYNSPILGGFSFSASWSDEDTYDAALRYAGEFGNIRAAAAIGWRRDMGPSWGPLSPGVETDTVVGSISLQEITTGIFGNFAYGNQDVSGLGTVEGYEGRMGIEIKAGGGATVTPFGRYMHMSIGDGEGDLYGGGLVWSFGPVDIYGTYSYIDVEGENINIGLAGARIKF